jgi:hypothetical protein
MSEPLLTRLAAGILDGEGLAYAVILLEECHSEIERLRAAHAEIIRKCERITLSPPEWTNFGSDDERLKFAREAWFGAAQISRKALNETR